MSRDFLKANSLETPSQDNGLVKKTQLLDRGQWANKLEFLLAVAGTLVGLGNLWRFPYLCYKNGGGAFLVPYILFLLACGIPMFLLETAMGQFTSQGCITCWRHFCPLFEGIGYATQVVIAYAAVSYIVIQAWAFFYLFSSFSAEVVYFTATFPYVMLVVLLARGLTLPGAMDGLAFYLYPDPTRLVDPQVWMDAGAQVLFSFGICQGSLTALGSYNQYNNDCYKDTFVLCLVNGGSSFVAGFAIFSVLGFMSYEQGLPISEVAASGPGLAFIAYPRAVAMMPLPQLWSICFFIMVILLGADTQFVSLECLMTSVTDMFPTVFRRAYRRELLLLCLCSVCFFLGLLLVTEGGLYFLQLFDHYVCSGNNLLLLSVCQSIAIGWIYGADRLYDNIEDMIGYRPWPLMKICWLYITPTVCLGTFIFSVVKYKPLKFNKTYVYPTWAYALGWFLGLFCVFLVPMWIIFKVTQMKGSIWQSAKAAEGKVSLTKTKTMVCLCQPERRERERERHYCRSFSNFSTPGSGVLLRLVTCSTMADSLCRLCRLSPKTASQTIEERGKWDSKKEFILSVAGAVIGLGNVWRFPYLCYKNGGGAFFIPYILFLVTCGVPLFVLETALGQYTSLGGIMCWRKVCPLFEGIGYASQMIIFYGCISYIVILAWAFLYFFSSFSAELPWATCNNTWNTDSCMILNNYNTTANWTTPVNSSSSVVEFWQRRVLNISTGIENLGNIQWDLSLCLLLAWIICYFCIWKGVRSTGKATYVTATFPFLMLVVLLVRGMTLPGAFRGIKYYLYPNPARLADPQVWMDAGTQIFYSYAICLGCLTTLGSYNKYNNNCYRDSFYLCLLNSGTSFVSGFAIFSVLGYMSQKQGIDISSVADSGPGLVFIVYPQAVTLLPWPQVWSVCFFSMIILLGIDGQFVGLESIITSLTDIYPSQIRKGYRREFLLLLICALCYMIGLVLVSQAGAYILQIFDHYVCSGPTLLLMAIFQSVIIGWIYGAERFSDNIEDMIGYKPMSLIKYCWMYGTPLVCSGTLVFLLLKYTPMKFNNSYVYPWWAYLIGWFLAMSSLIMIPVTIVCKLARGKGTLCQRLKKGSKPAGDLPVMAKEMRSVNISLHAHNDGKNGNM
ncbi:hypothetical protein L3Q82_007635 [Scortum barcoo]|uniref:Uncharacterized protein n=1 Tax=Scortum barcoo TaxID=214431 RepID=A0ACB8WP22_9TELE|nr:hypothetical protein L3Q82_007635 [Scortum barcoo]